MDSVQERLEYLPSHYLRLCEMSPSLVAYAGQARYTETQYRYDYMNKKILDNYGQIDRDFAKKLVDFLNPSGEFPEFYKDAPTSSDGKRKAIIGSISLNNLTDIIMESYFGYYGDEWVKITLPEYLGPIH